MTQKIDATTVRAMREATKLDQAGFGRAIGVSERTVRGWEKGAVIPDAMQLLLDGMDCALAAGSAPAAWAARIRERFASVQ